MTVSEPGRHAIETMQVEERRFPPSAEFAAQANAKPDIYERDFDGFWTEEAKRVTWYEPFQELYEWKPPFAKFYLGGKLNVAYNCVDRHVEAGLGDKVAYHWEGEPAGETRTITFAMIGKFAAPSNIVFTPELPKTRSGKIMRRLLRDVAENRVLGDTTTLADPTVVDEIGRRAKTEAGKEE
ncbi:MAG TPA: acetyl-coenzyme A synthetase N-terminal domain-containing protein [Candidatus Dormibacteraeota bacterium]|jgi:hypothetical protein